MDVHGADEVRAETPVDGAADAADDDDDDETETNASRARRKKKPPPPEVVLLDAADGSKVPMLVCASEEEQTRGTSASIGGAFSSTGLGAAREDATNARAEVPSRQMRSTSRIA